MTFTDSNGETHTYAEIRRLMKGENFPMSLTDPNEIDAVTTAVNRGIDSHLEACYCPKLGDSFTHGDRRIGSTVVAYTLECVVTPESMPVLLRRLYEDGIDSSLADCIITILKEET